MSQVSLRYMRSLPSVGGYIRGSLTQDKSTLTLITQNCRTNSTIGAILPSSPAYLATPSCPRAAPSPPHRVPLGAASNSHGGSPLASLETAPSCSRSLRASPV